VAYVFGQSPTFATGTGATISKAFAGSTTAHSLLVALITTDATAPGTFTVTGGGTWVTLAAKKEPTSTQWITVGYCLDATGGSAPTIQASWTGSGNFNGLMVGEFTNGGVASTLDASTVGTLGTSTTPTDAAMTLGTAADMIVSYALRQSGTQSAGSGFTIPTNGQGGNIDAWEYDLVAGPGSVTAAFTISVNEAWIIMSAAFKSAGAAGGATGPQPSRFHPGKGPFRLRLLNQPRPQQPQQPTLVLDLPEIVLRPRVPC
jgi:hypothetical protein